jgi:hypothetical protein
MSRRTSIGGIMYLTWGASNKSLADFFIYCIIEVTEPVLGICLKQLSFGADPDTDLPFYFDADPNSDPSPAFTHVGK